MTTAKQTRKAKRMRLSKGDVERRRAVALNFFRNNPTATGEALNKGFQTGTLTGVEERAMNLATIYKLRKEARSELALQEIPPTIPAEEFKNARRFGAEAAVVDPTLTREAQDTIRALVSAIGRLDPSVTDITVHRNGEVGIGKVTRTETVLKFG